MDNRDNIPWLAWLILVMAIAIMAGPTYADEAIKLDPNLKAYAKVSGVSEPMLLRLPETPLTLAYSLRLGSSLMASSAKAGPDMMAMATTDMSHASQGMLSLFSM